MYQAVILPSLIYLYCPSSSGFKWEPYRRRKAATLPVPCLQQESKESLKNFRTFDKTFLLSPGLTLIVSHCYTFKGYRTNLHRVFILFISAPRRSSGSPGIPLPLESNSLKAPDIPFAGSTPNLKTLLTLEVSSISYIFNLFSQLFL